jgi:hypothetical protein
MSAFNMGITQVSLRYMQLYQRIKHMPMKIVTMESRKTRTQGGKSIAKRTPIPSATAM